MNQFDAENSDMWNVMDNDLLKVLKTYALIGHTW